MLPAFIPIYNLQGKGEIGDVIGGITAPIIGIFSSVLLYLALSRQTQSNKEQRFKNDSDLIFLLLNQLEIEISSFYTAFTVRNVKGSEEKTFYGVQGIDDFTSKLLKETGLQTVHSFKDYYESNQIMIIISSIKLIQLAIDESALENTSRVIFKTKLYNIYKYRLKDQFEFIINAVDKKPYLKDKLTDEIQQFSSDIEFLSPLSKA